MSEKAKKKKSSEFSRVPHPLSKWFVGLDTSQMPFHPLLQLLTGPNLKIDFFGKSAETLFHLIILVFEYQGTLFSSKCSIFNPSQSFCNV